MLRPSLMALVGLAVITVPVFAETMAGSVRAGNAFYTGGKYEEALMKYQAAQVESPSDERIMFNIGNAQYKLSRYDEALSEYLKSAQIEDPKIQAQSHYNAGNALYRAGRLEEAVERYLKTLEIEPDDEDAKFNLEFVRREIQRRMNEQQQRQQEQQKENEAKQEKEESDGQDPLDQEKQDQSQQHEPGQRNKQEKKEENSQEESSQSEGSEEPKDQKQENVPARAEEMQRRMNSENGPDEANIQRLLDAIEAETAENMKGFLRKQQPAAAVVQGEDW